VRTAQYAALLPDECDQCAWRDCDRSYGIGTRGEDCRGDDPQAVVAWSRCPWTWGAGWTLGQETLSPSEVCRWLVEIGRHRDPHLSAGGHAILREWSRQREIPGRLGEARAIEAARVRAAGGKGGGA